MAPNRTQGSDTVRPTLIALAILTAAAVAWFALPRGAPVLILDATAQRGDEDVAVYFTLRNDGDADRLIAVSSPDAASVEIVAPDVGMACRSRRITTRSSRRTAPGCG